MVTCNTIKSRFFTNTKDRITKLASSFVVYHFHCPGCHHDYIGKTERTIWERINEHGCHDRDSVIYKHITNCKGVSYLADLWNIDNKSAEREKCGRKTFRVNIVKENTCIIDKARQVKEKWRLKKNVQHLIVVSKRPRN